MDDGLEPSNGDYLWGLPDKQTVVTDFFSKTTHIDPTCTLDYMSTCTDLILLVRIAKINVFRYVMYNTGFFDVFPCKWGVKNDFDRTAIFHLEPRFWDNSEIYVRFNLK